jgi:hypothetical protein
MLKNRILRGACNVKNCIFALLKINASPRFQLSSACLASQRVRRFFFYGGRLSLIHSLFAAKIQNVLIYCSLVFIKVSTKQSLYYQIAVNQHFNCFQVYRQARAAVWIWAGCRDAASREAAAAARRAPLNVSE